MKIVPTVVIVGRMNVGKSTLFNRLAPVVKSMTRDYAGITRDILSDTVSWCGRSFDLIDTGGLSFYKHHDQLQEKVHAKARATLIEADLILLVVDGAVGVLDEDREIIKQLHSLKKKFLVVINKADTHASELYLHEFAACGGIAHIIISAEHGTNIADLLEGIITHLPPVHSEEDLRSDPRYRVTLLGRPNVGKSSLMNALVDYERSIVFDEPGTTREAISEHIIFNQEHLILTDTPGLRRKSAVTEHLEEDMVYSSLQALAHADIVLLVIDGSIESFVDQELKLGFYAFTERHKALIIIVNKSDKMDDASRAGLATVSAQYQHLLGKVPIVTLSCVTKKHVAKVLPLVQKVWERHSQQLPMGEVYHLFQQALEKSPLIRNKQKLLVKEVRQLATAPITIGMSVNEPAWFGATQRAFFENILRSQYELLGASIKFIIRKKLSRGE